MEDQPTCGKGLAENSALPAKVGEVIDSMAGVLEAHIRALDPTDDSSRKEREAYSGLAEGHRRIAADLRTAAAAMAGYRDLPMGRHDPEAMLGPEPVEAFERFVSAEEELLAMLQRRLEADRTMLTRMRRGSG